MILGGFIILPMILYSAGTSQFTLEITATSQCSDGIDNDSDTKIDFPTDPGCIDALDNDETDPVICGNGICTTPTETCSNCAVDCGSCPSGGSGGGGGGGGGSIISQITTTDVFFSGYAYPNSILSVLRDSVSVKTINIGSDGVFNFSINDVNPGQYTFTIFVTDPSGLRSGFVSIPVKVEKGTTVSFNDIFISPTVYTDSKEVKQGDSLIVSGYTMPYSDITTSLNGGEKQININSKSGRSGAYVINISTENLKKGEYSFLVQAMKNSRKSNESVLSVFDVSDKTIKSEPLLVVKGVDFNTDGKINLVDFSIMMYWYGRSGYPNNMDLNKDGKITLVDFSILIYHWTG